VHVSSGNSSNTLSAPIQQPQGASSSQTRSKSSSREQLSSHNSSNGMATMANVIIAPQATANAIGGDNEAVGDGPKALSASMKTNTSTSGYFTHSVIVQEVPVCGLSVHVFLFFFLFLFLFFLFLFLFLFFLVVLQCFPFLTPSLIPPLAWTTPRALASRAASPAYPHVVPLPYAENQPLKAHQLRRVVWTRTTTAPCYSRRA
jgi:hypothetical protein